MKNFFTIAADLPFLDTLARELWRQTQGDSLHLSQHLILLPNRRACRQMGAALARAAAGQATLLPRLQPIGDADEDELAFQENAFMGSPTVDLPPAVSPLKRLMLLTRQVMRRDPGLSCDQAAQAAEALARFLDEVEIEQCDIGKLPQLVAETELAAHWQQTVQFLDIVTRYWPLILAEQGLLDPAARRNRLLAAQAALWRVKPPAFPVIAAGSTGSLPAVAELLDVIASLPDGKVVLPGLDQMLDDAAWDGIEESHPQYSMKRLLDKAEVGRGAVKDWVQGAVPSPRLRLLSEAARPAAFTEAWRDLRGAIGPEAVAGLSRLSFDHPQEEAQAIALRLRGWLEAGGDQTAAFVTSDRDLAARVAALLQRWHITVDDSGGVAFARLPLGSFLNLTLAAARPHSGAADLLALLKHPLAACGLAPAACRAQARESEISLRRHAEEAFEWTQDPCVVLRANWHHKHQLSFHIDAHIKAAEAIARSDSESGADRLWQGETGDSFTEWLDEWRASADGFPPLSGRDYAGLFAALTASHIFRSAHATHPRLSILGVLEAQLIRADLIIIGGLNEGGWPPDAGFDPWMSRPMRKKFGLSAPEFRIGLSAHAFMHHAASAHVLLTRSLRKGGTPTVPSRFLLQLEAVLRAAGLSDATRDALQPAEPWRLWSQALDIPAAVKAEARPQPRPALAHRPTSLSVTDIGAWLRNPYAIYAKHILKLRKLEELDAALDAADRGVMIHQALEEFLCAHRDVLPEDADEKLLAIGRAIFARGESNPRVRAFWWSNFTAIAKWFIANETQRRQDGVLPLHVEAKGEIRLGSFRLQGRADRVDRLPDGTLSIIDYKTGGAPSVGEIDSGIEPQLPLLALIAEKGGLAGTRAVSGVVEYWILKGGRGGCETRRPKKAVDDLVGAAEQGLLELIRVFADTATAYEAIPRPRLQPRFNDYAHLSRLAEWGRTGNDI